MIKPGIAITSFKRDTEHTMSEGRKTGQVGQMSQRSGSSEKTRQATLIAYKPYQSSNYKTGRTPTAKRDLLVQNKLMEIDKSILTPLQATPSRSRFVSARTPVKSSE